MLCAVIGKGGGKNLLGAFFLGVLLCFWPVSSRTEESPLSGAVLLKHCEAALQDDAPPSFETGSCVGILETLRYIQPLLDPKYEKAHYCLPPGLPADQETRTVVTYLQAHPERLQEEGRTLALDALHQAFPCENNR